MVTGDTFDSVNNSVSDKDKARDACSSWKWIMWQITIDYLKCNQSMLKSFVGCALPI